MKTINERINLRAKMHDSLNIAEVKRGRTLRSETTKANQGIFVNQLLFNV